MELYIPPVVIYVDVDDTLVRSHGAKRIPIPMVIKHVRSLFEQGAELFCWSSGGADYARDSAFEVGLGDCFKAFLPKPNIILDDQQISDWRRLLQVHPGNNSTETLEGYRLKLGSAHQKDSDRDL